MTTWLKTRGFGSEHNTLSQASLIIVVVLLCLSFYNVIELNFIIFGTFKRYSGTYFWSFLVATWGVAIISIGFFVKFYGPLSLAYVSCTLSFVGWVSMVTGQSMVLWSRLHLVLQGQRQLKIILWIIIIDGFICHGTVMPLIFGSFSSKPERWQKPYSVMEKFELVLFFLQELLLSSIYIVEAFKLMRLEQSTRKAKQSRGLMKHLILVNVIVILLDSSVLALEFANLYNFQISWKPFVYSVKLKVEFTILNRLIEITSAKNDIISNIRSQDFNTVNCTGVGLEPTSEASGKPVCVVSSQAPGMFHQGYATGDGESSSNRV